MNDNDLSDDELKLKAIVEFGSSYTYEIYSGGLGKTLRIITETKEDATIIRKIAPTTWENINVIVVYPTNIKTSEDLEENKKLYDPKLK